MPQIAIIREAVRPFWPIFCQFLPPATVLIFAVRIFNSCQRETPSGEGDSCGRWTVHTIFQSGVQSRYAVPTRARNSKTAMSAFFSRNQITSHRVVSIISKLVHHRVPACCEKRYEDYRARGSAKKNCHTTVPHYREQWDKNIVNTVSVGGEKETFLFSMTYFKLNIWETKSLFGAYRESILVW